ncbi:MAG: hypothetical protein M0C28_41490 [Candidatus Moduliflexus flocculans]|nr:hypothetical protein [Candidatus Moduliflexus flocculans]
MFSMVVPTEELFEASYRLLTLILAISGIGLGDPGGGLPLPVPVDHAAPGRGGGHRGPGGPQRPVGSAERNRFLRRRDEIGDLARSVDRMIGGLRGIVSAILDAEPEHFPGCGADEPDRPVPLPGRDRAGRRRGGSLRLGGGDGLLHQAERRQRRGHREPWPARPRRHADPGRRGGGRDGRRP